MEALRLALDWTPNTIHTGFYVAQALGHYKQAGITVEFILPDADKYQLTPAKRVAQGTADVALAPTESVLSYRLNNVPLVAIAAVLARDASAIVTLRQSGVDRPQKLDGRVYASYNARFEDDIVRQMIRNDGGRGQLITRKPHRLGIWHSLLTAEADATWVFLPWEGVEAEMKDVALNAFTLEEYEIPYGYSPVLLAHADTLRNRPDTLRRFMAATTKGYHFAVAQPEEAARLLVETAAHATLHDADFVEQSQRSINNYYLDEAGQWGHMSRHVWNGFVHWLLRHDFLTNADGEKVRHVAVDELFTNEYIGRAGQ